MSSSHRAQLQLGYIEQLFSGESTSVVVTLYVGEYTIFLYKNVVFSCQAECSHFSANFSLKLLNRNWKRKNLSWTFCGLFIFFLAVYYKICFSRTVHRTVISTEHLSITNAGFFVLLGSFAVRGSNNLIRSS